MKKAISNLLTPPVHFIGIGGSGMSALAELCLKSGVKVQGSDVADSRAVRRLTSLGANISDAQDGSLIETAGSVVYSSAIKEDNPDRLAAKKKKIPLFHRSDLLAELIKDKSAITVAGTHGKTSTTAIIAHVLEALGQDPSVAVGGRCLSYDSSAKLGKKNLFVAEADESDGSLLKYEPYVSVLTNIDSDHMDYFRDLSHLQSTFETYLGNVKEDGIAVIGWDNQLSRAVGSSYEGNRLTYGFLIGSEIRAIGYECRDGKMTFKAVVERDVIPVSMNLIGRHNATNALCALAVVRALELDVAKAAKSLGSYKGVSRRLSPVYEKENLTIFDDYAHNPGKISACVSSIKESWPRRKLFVIFQPHRYSRLETMYSEMTAAFSQADHITVLPVYAAGETTTKDFSPKKISDDISINSKKSSRPSENFDDTVAWLCDNVKEDSVVLTVGAGDVYEVGYLLKEALS